jgi:hypothetical protein
MSTNVYANGKEVAAKKSDNQSIAAMPDVCLSPPSPPAGPIPIPYPNFSAASDMADGTKTVKIAGDEVGMKDQSNYKTSKGDEAATKSLGMGVVTHGIQGKTFFAAWSSDVMFEGANAVRFMDMTTGNHSSDPPNSADTTVCTGTPSAPPEKKKDCKELQDDNDKARTTPPCPSPSQQAARTTLTTGQYQAPGGGLTSVKGFSRQLIGKNGWSKGVGPGNSSKLGGCAGFDYKRKSFMPHSSHTEARIIEDLFQSPPVGGPLGSLGTLTMRIQWNKADGVAAGPCDACEDLICSAIKCGLDIHICSDDDVDNGSEGTKPECQ